MGDPNARQLLEENHRLKHEREKLSSVLGEEKEMVKYLHGVIKNYEHLLRSNSRKDNQYSHLTTRKMTDTKTVLSAKMAKLKPSVLHTKREEETKQESNVVEDATAGLRSTDLRHDAHGLQTVKKQTIQHQEPLSTDDDIFLEDLEYYSISSADELTDDCSLTPEMERRRFSDRSRVNWKESQEKQKVEIARTYEDNSRSRDCNQKSFDNNYIEDNLNEQHSYKDRQVTTKDKETIKRTNHGQSTFVNQEPSTSFDKEIDDLNKELDKIAKRLNRYQKSLCRNEKYLGKIEHRMEYLESFALGEESEYL